MSGIILTVWRIRVRYPFSSYRTRLRRCHEPQLSFSSHVATSGARPQRSAAKENQNVRLNQEATVCVYASTRRPKFMPIAFDGMAIADAHICTHPMISAMSMA